MTAYSFHIGRSIKYLLTGTTIAAFLTSSCVSSWKKTLLPTYESKTGLAFPQSVIDLACLANSFPSRFQQKQDETNTCFSQVYQNYTEIKHIDGLSYDEVDQSFVSNIYPSLGIKGLHLKVFEKVETAEPDNPYVFIIVRHQEHDSVLTDEMNEMMSLFGPAATADRQQGSKEVFGASAVSSMIRFVRKQLGLDYLPQAIAMVDKIQRQYKAKTDVKYIFSGFSSGGLYAIVLALYFNQPAVTFSATGVEDIVHIYYSDLFSEKHTQLVIPPIFNFAHELDPVPQLDCQLGTLCLFQTESLQEQKQFTEQELELLHLNTIFGPSEPQVIQWLRQPERWTCSTADSYNLKYGSCKRERMRWKEKMRSNSADEETIKEDL